MEISCWAVAGVAERRRNIVLIFEIIHDWFTSIEIWTARRWLGGTVEWCPTSTCGHGRETRAQAFRLMFGRRMDLSRSHGDTEMIENEIGTTLVNFGLALHTDRIHAQL